MKFQIICSLLALAVVANANPWPNFFSRSNQNGQPAVNPPSVNPPSMNLPSMNEPQVPRQLGDCPIKAALTRLLPFLNQFETPANIERLIKSIVEDLQLVISRVAKLLNNLPAELQNDVQNALDALQKIVDDLISSLQELVTLIANATSLEGINDLVSFLISNITNPLRSALGLVQTIATNLQIPVNQLLGNTLEALSALIRGLLTDVLKLPGLVTQLVGRLLSGDLLSTLNSILSLDFSSLFGSSIGGSAGLGNSAGLRRSASLGSSRMSISPISFWDDLASRALNQYG